jgi:hypothetical protein
MSSRKTFLHYLTSSADPETTAKFQRIIADQADDFEKLIRDINEHDKKFNRKPGKDNFWNKIKSPWNEINKPEKSPLDLEPEELDRLLQVPRNSKDQIDFEFKLIAETMDPSLPATKIESEVALFWGEHKNLFDSAKDIMFDPKTLELHYSGDKKIAEDLLKKLKVKPKIIEDVLSGKYSKNREMGQVQFELPLDEDNLAKKIGPNEVEGIVERFFDLNEDNYNSKDDITYDEDSKKLLYQGPKGLARQLLNEIGVKSEVIEKVLKFNKKTYLSGKPPLAQNFFSVQIPIDDLGLDAGEVENALGAWLTSRDETGKTAHLDKAEDALLFTGDKYMLDSLLSTAGLRLSANQMDRILKNLNSYKINK